MKLDDGAQRWIKLPFPLTLWAPGRWSEKLWRPGTASEAHAESTAKTIAANQAMLQSNYMPEMAMLLSIWMRSAMAAGGVEDDEGAGDDGGLDALPPPLDGDDGDGGSGSDVNY